MYSTNNETTRNVCETIDAIFEINFVETMRRNGKIYVRGTAGKPDEHAWLRAQCEKHGYVYSGK